MSRRLELDDLHRLPMISDPQLSPDGTRVAFVVTRADREKDVNRSTIWMAATDGSDPPRPLTQGDKDASPRWSPDGRWLAFVSARGDQAKPQVRLLPTGGGEAQVLTDAKAGAASPVWSPDGSRLAFLSPVGELAAETSGGDVGGGDTADGGDDPVRRNRPVVARSVQYKSDGGRLLGTKRTHLFVCDRDSGEVVQLTKGDFSVGSPAWSPDGSQLAFASSLHEDRDLDLASHLFQIDAAGGEPRPLTSGLTAAVAPA